MKSRNYLVAANRYSNRHPRTHITLRQPKLPDQEAIADYVSRHSPVASQVDADETVVFTFAMTDEGELVVYMRVRTGEDESEQYDWKPIIGFDSLGQIIKYCYPTNSEAGAFVRNKLCVETEPVARVEADQTTSLVPPESRTPETLALLEYYVPITVERRLGYESELERINEIYAAEIAKRSIGVRCVLSAKPDAETEIASESQYGTLASKVAEWNKDPTYASDQGGSDKDAFEALAHEAEEGDTVALFINGAKSHEYEFQSGDSPLSQQIIIPPNCNAVVNVTRRDNKSRPTSDRHIYNAHDIEKFFLSHDAYDVSVVAVLCDLEGGFNDLAADEYVVSLVTCHQFRLMHLPSEGNLTPFLKFYAYPVRHFDDWGGFFYASQHPITDWYATLQEPSYYIPNIPEDAENILLVIPKNRTEVDVPPIAEM